MIPVNTTVVFGIILTAAGVIIFAVSQLFLRRWVKKYNSEWSGGFEENEMS